MDSSKPTRTAGRPRDPGLDVAIRAATIELVGEGGMEACALDEVARRAGVGKATIYRRWPSKDSLIADAFRHTPTAEVPDRDRGSLEADVREYLCGLLEALQTPLARAARQVLPQLPQHPELAQIYRTRMRGSWGTALRDVVARAEARGDVERGALPMIVLQAATAMLTQRWLLDPTPAPTRRPVPDDALVDELIDSLLRPYLART